jgi:hypothetical protein
VATAAVGLGVALGAGHQGAAATAARLPDRALQPARVVAPRARAKTPAPPLGELAQVPAAGAGATASGQPQSFRPALLVLPDGASAPVQPAGVHADGAMALPEDPRRVGWWTGGAQAGDPFGSVVIAGHVDSRVHGLGVLARLTSVAVGDTITLTSGASRLRYRVTGIDTVLKARLAEDADVFRQDVPGRLVLITCGGAFDPRRHSYEKNVVILATPVV